MCSAWTAPWAPQLVRRALRWFLRSRLLPREADAQFAEPDGPPGWQAVSLSTAISLVKSTGVDSHRERSMYTQPFWIEGKWPGRLAVSPRQRGGDWLEDEMKFWQRSGISLVVSLL